MVTFVACAPADDDDDDEIVGDSAGLNQESGGGDAERAAGHYFPAGAPWYQDVTAAEVDASSDLVIGAEVGGPVRQPRPGRHRAVRPRAPGARRRDPAHVRV